LACFGSASSAVQHPQISPICKKARNRDSLSRSSQPHESRSPRLARLLCCGKEIGAHLQEYCWQGGFTFEILCSARKKKTHVVMSALKSPAPSLNKRAGHELCGCMANFTGIPNTDDCFWKGNHIRKNLPHNRHSFHSRCAVEEVLHTFRCMKILFGSGRVIAKDDGMIVPVLLQTMDLPVL